MDSCRSFVRAVLVAGLLPALCVGAWASPAPKATGRPTAHQVHRAIVTCGEAPFYNWPTSSGAPYLSIYPAARSGDVFDVIGDGTLTYNALTLYETTIDVVEPFGYGKHYWISARCVNAG